MEATWPCLKEINPEEAYLGSLLGCMENLRSGTTFIIDNYYMAASKKSNIDAVLKGVAETGIKAIMARGYHDYPFNIPEEFLEQEDEVVEEYKRMLDVWHGAEQGKIKFGSARESAVFQLILPSKVWDLAQSYGVGIHTHVAEASLKLKKSKALR